MHFLFVPERFSGCFFSSELKVSFQLAPPRFFFGSILAFMLASFFSLWLSLLVLVLYLKIRRPSKTFVYRLFPAFTLTRFHRRSHDFPSPPNLFLKSSCLCLSPIPVSCLSSFRNPPSHDLFLEVSRFRFPSGSSCRSAPDFPSLGRVGFPLNFFWSPPLNTFPPVDSPPDPFRFRSSLPFNGRKTSRLLQSKARRLFPVAENFFSEVFESPSFSDVLLIIRPSRACS